MTVCGWRSSVFVRFITGSVCVSDCGWQSSVFVCFHQRFCVCQ